MSDYGVRAELDRIAERRRNDPEYQRRMEEQADSYEAEQAAIDRREALTASRRRRFLAADLEYETPIAAEHDQEQAKW